MYICIYICADPITSTVVTCMKARCPFYAAVYDTTGKPCSEPLIRLYSSSIQALLMHCVDTTGKRDKASIKTLVRPYEGSMKAL